MTGGMSPRWGAFFLLAWLVALTTAPAAAQQMVGRAVGPSVTVDYGVLDELGPPPTVPSVLLGGISRPSAAPWGAGRARFPVPGAAGAASPTDRIVLTPPGKKKRAARKSAKRKRPASAKKPSRRVASAKPRRPKTVQAAKPPAPPPKRVARASAPPPPPDLPLPPPVPLTAAPAAPAAPPPVGSLPPPPPPAIAGLPPPMPVPVAPSVAPSRPAPERKKAAEPAPPAPAAPPPAPTARPAPEPPKMAALPTPASVPAAGAPAQILFEAGSAKLDNAATDSMKRIADAMKSDESMRVQLLAYAGGGGSSSQARRLSLSRALAVRSYLIGQGVRSTRIDVRALGNKSSAGSPDRVDMTVVRR